MKSRQESGAFDNKPHQTNKHNIWITSAKSNIINVSTNQADNLDIQQYRFVSYTFPIIQYQTPTYRFSQSQVDFLAKTGYFVMTVLNCSRDLEQ